MVLFCDATAPMDFDEQGTISIQEIRTVRPRNELSSTPPPSINLQPSTPELTTLFFSSCGHHQLVIPWASTSHIHHYYYNEEDDLTSTLVLHRLQVISLTSPVVTRVLFLPKKSMNKNSHISGYDNNMQRQFPNEISSIVVDYLVDDPLALRNVALLCHDFASLAQSRIFEHVNLEDGPKLASGYMPWSRWSRYQRHDYVPLMYRFNALLSNPQTGFLGTFVRRLDLDPCLGPLRNMEHAEVDVTISSIFQQLPALTELRINHGRCEHFGPIETYLSQQLKELWIGHTTIRDRKCFEYFQNMLTSLTALTRLTINNCSLGHPLDVASNPIRALIFPSSLKAACVTGTDERTFRALGLGLECPQAPVLSSFLSDFRNEVEDRSILWKGLGTHSSIILDVGNMMYWPGGLTMWNRADPVASYLPAMISVTRGMEGPNLTLCCSQLYQLIVYFAHFISVLPESVRRICIDFNAGATDGPPDLHHLDGWVKLDNTLTSRHAVGLLESVCFRCTKRTISGNGPSFESGTSLDRTILNRVAGLLHRADVAGILEIDYTTVFSEF